MLRNPIVVIKLRWKQRIPLQQQRLVPRGLQSVDAVQILSGLESALAAVGLTEFVANATPI